MTTMALLASQQPAEALALGARWADSGDTVTVVLLDGATTILRTGHALRTLLSTAQEAGVTVWAHDAAVTERGIAHGDDIVLVGLDRVAELVAEQASKVQWW